MNRFCGGLVTAFRVLQLLLSLLLLACGVFITYQMFSTSSTAHRLEETFVNLQNNATALQDLENDIGANNDGEIIDGFVTVLNEVLVPILHALQGTPTRAIIVAVVGLWSTIFTISLIISHHYSTKTNHLNVNRRSIRIPLELLTLLFWIIAIICSALLTVEYGVLVLASGGGVEAKLAVNSLKDLLRKATGTAGSSLDSLLRSLDIVNDVIEVGAASIVALASSVVCGLVSLVSLGFSCCCCITGKKRRSDRDVVGVVGYLDPSLSGRGVVDKKKQQQVRYQAMEVVPPAQVYVRQYGMGY